MCRNVHDFTTHYTLLYYTCIVQALSVLLYFYHAQIFLLSVHIGLCSAQAPGDENHTCFENHTYAHTYPDNWRVLMDSWNYEQLLPGHSGQPIAGAVWTDASCDDNDDAQFPSITPPYVSVHVTHHSTSCMS